MKSNLVRTLLLTLCIGLSQAQYGQYGLNQGQNLGQNQVQSPISGQYPGGLVNTPGNPNSRILGLLGGGGGGGLFSNLLSAFTGNRLGFGGRYPAPIPAYPGYGGGYPGYGGFGGFYPGYGGYYG